MRFVHQCHKRDGTEGWKDTGLKVGRLEPQLMFRIALEGDTDVIPSTHSAADSDFFSSSRRSDLLSQAPWAPGSHVLYRHTCRKNMHTHEMEKK